MPFESPQPDGNGEGADTSNGRGRRFATRKAGERTHAPGEVDGDASDPGMAHRIGLQHTKLSVAVPAVEIVTSDGRNAVPKRPPAPGDERDRDARIEPGA